MTTYIILSPKHGTDKEPVFWRPDNSGYTTIPWAAGLYSEQQVKGNPTYYNDGYNSLAIPLTAAGLHSIGFKCSYSQSKVNALKKEVQNG